MSDKTESDLDNKSAKNQIVSLEQSVADLQHRLAQAQSALETSRAQNAAFLSNLSREIRTPLNGILGCLGFLRDSRLGPDQREQIRIIRDCAEHLLSTVGDMVDFEVVEDGTGVISNIHERTNCIVRKSVNLSHESHVVAANLDRAFLVVTLASPRTSTGFMDRFLVTAEAYGIPTTMVLNKVDALSAEERATADELAEVYRKVGEISVVIFLKFSSKSDFMVPSYAPPQNMVIICIELTSTYMSA